MHHPIRAIRSDWTTDRTSIEWATGEVARFEQVGLGRLPASSQVALTEVRPYDAVLHCVTKRGDLVTVDLPRLEPPSRVGSRPVIYLDQKDWRTVSDVGFGRGDSYPVAEQEAAADLARVVKAGHVILPMSGAHLLETTKWSDEDRRYELGLTILQLSRGWQLLWPRLIRVGEVRAALASRGSPSAPLGVANAISLIPHAMRGKDMSGYRAPLELGPQEVIARQAQLAMMSYIGVMLDARQSQAGDVQDWVEWQQALTNWLRLEGLHREALDAEVDAFFLRDTHEEIAEAASAVGISFSQLSAWMAGAATRDIPRMPANGIFREVLRERHLNPGTTWKQNDLIDATYLCSAAGYVDYVVGERHFTAVLERAIARLGRRVRVFRRLRDLMDAPEFKDIAGTSRGTPRHR